MRNDDISFLSLYQPPVNARGAARFRVGKKSPKVADEEADLEKEAIMKASRTYLVAASLIVAAGSAVFAASTGPRRGCIRPCRRPRPFQFGGAASATRSSSASAALSAIAEIGSIYSASSARTKAKRLPQKRRRRRKPPSIARRFPRSAAAAAWSSGPRIIEIGGQPARRGPWPVVVYGDPKP